MRGRGVFFFFFSAGGRSERDFTSLRFRYDQISAKNDKCTILSWYHCLEIFSKPQHSGVSTDVLFPTMGKKKRHRHKN